MPRARPTHRRHHEEVAPLRERRDTIEVADRLAFTRLTVVVPQFHIEPGPALRNLAANMAQPKDAQPLARDARMHPQRVAPHALAGRLIELGHIPHYREQQRESVIGDARGIGPRAVSQDDVAAARMVDRNVFVAGAERADEFQPWHPVDFLGCQAGGAVGQDRPHLVAVCGNRLGTRGGIGCIDDFIGRLDASKACVLQENQNQQVRFCHGLKRLFDEELRRWKV